MTPNPILKVLFTLKAHRVKCLLIGGQACIIYGAAEFSRDSDFLILCTPGNLKFLQNALDELKAKPVYLPPLRGEFLERGHACHFRCSARGVEGLRIDLIAKIRGCGPFEKLWKRRNKIALKNGTSIDVICLAGLVQSKKTQRDKDWLMLKRLVDNDVILKNYLAPGGHVKWWLRQCRDAGLLIELVRRYPKLAKECCKQRPLLSSALGKDKDKIELRLRDEELKERQKDIEYWTPLKKELEILRHKKLK